MECLEKYYGIPYLQDGRSFDGCDCFGLFWLWYFHELGVCLPGYEATYSKDASLGQANATIEGLYQFFSSTPLPFDRASIRRHDVLYMTYGNEAHCGVVLNGRQFIHSLRKIGVSVSNIATWKPRIKGIYRYVD